MNLPDQLFTSIAGNPGARAKSSVDELKRMIGNIRNSVSGPKSNQGGDPSIDDLVKKYGG